MTRALDHDRYPHAAAYLARLPQGVASYPACRVRTDVYADMPTVLATLRDEPDLPAEVRAFLSGGQRQEWISEVLGCTLLMLVRDTRHADDDGFLRWDYDRNVRLFQRPLYRVLMCVMSTTLLIMGATKRWSSFHQGSELHPEKVVTLEGRNRSQARLVYPPNLFEPLLVRIFAGAYRAALDVVRATDPRLEITATSDTEARFTISWQA